MSLPLGHRIDGEFVCMDCLRGDDHREGGIGGGSAVDQRVGSGEECSRCERRMPYLATVRLLPDGYGSLRAPKPIYGPGRKMVLLEREEKVLIDQHALVYVSIGCQREVGITVTPSGKIEVWVHDDPYGGGKIEVHDDPYGDGEEPSKRWEYDPNATPPDEVALLSLEPGVRRAAQRLSGRRAGEPDQGPERGAGEGTTRA